MASSAIFLTIISTIFASTSGFKIERPQSISEKYPISSGPTAPPLVRSPAAASQVVPDYKNQPIAGYPKVPPPNAQEAGGNEEDLLPPLEDSFSVYDHSKTQFFRRSIDDGKVDPKTGYPLVADPSWKYAGGNEDNLELPIGDSEKTEDEQTAVDPKTGYPLFAQPHWKDAGGNEEIISLPFEDTEENFGQRVGAVDPKTGYPLEANPSWKDAGGNEEILELPLEDLNERSDKEAVDPKTGYPLVAQESWKDAGGNEEILELPLEESDKEAVDPKTGYPLVAKPFWKNAGGDGDILEPPLEIINKNSNTAAVHPNPLTAQPGRDGDVLQLRQQPLDKLPVEEAVDPKTGYPLVARSEWKDAGGDGDILELPLEHPNDNSLSQVQSQFGGEYDVFEIIRLTELQPPPLEKNFPTVSSNSFSTPSPFTQKQTFSNAPSSSQNRKISSQAQQEFNKGIQSTESFYANTGPENVIVTVTRFLSTDKQEKQNYQPNNQQRSSLRNGFNQNENFRSSITGKQTFQNNFQGAFHSPQQRSVF